MVGKAKVVGRWTTDAETGEKTYGYVTIPDTQPTQHSRRLATRHLWYMLVEEYSLRHLTKLSDRLPALSGLAQLFASSMLPGDIYISGLWKTDLINGLCWKRAGDMRSLPVAQSSSATEYIAPSFSWASLDAPVSFNAECGYEVPVGMTVASLFEASVLDAAASPAGVDPLGRISAAHIKLESYAIFFKAAKELHASIRPRFDIESEADTLPADDRLLCLSIQSRVTLSNNPSHYNRDRKPCLLILSMERTQ